MNVNREIEKRPALPPGWRWVKLGDMGEIIAGQSPPGHSYRKAPEGLPFFQGKADFGKRHPIARTWCVEPTKLAKPRDILISIRAPVGPTNVANQECCIGRGLAAIRCGNDIEMEFLLFWLKQEEENLEKKGSGSTFGAINRKDLVDFDIPLPPLADQKRIAGILNEQMEAIEKARAAAEAQLAAARALQFSYIREALSRGPISSVRLGECLDEVTEGIGETWMKFEVLGATRNGLALAKEPPGKHPERYKYVNEGTIFYNPMRILLGSIAYLDFNDNAGITSPDYVVFKTKSGVLHHRWFYHWLRSPFGDKLIRSQARGAVRERMLFNRFCKGLIDLPSWEAQTDAAEKIGMIKPLIKHGEALLNDINSLPAALLRRAFSGEI